MNTPTTARWRRFSLRTLFVIVSACCLLLGAWSIYVNPFRLQAQSLASTACEQGEVIILPASGPPWYRWIVTSMLGHDAFIQAIRVDLSDKPVGDAELRSLGGLCYLQKLNLDHTQVSDASIPALASMRDLMSLSARYTNLTDRSAASIARLQGLQSLSLTGTQLTDASVNDLAKLKELRELYIRWTRISNEGAHRLRELLPGCAVYHSALANEEPSVLADSGQ